MASQRQQQVSSAVKLSAQSSRLLKDGLGEWRPPPSVLSGTTNDDREHQQLTKGHRWQEEGYEQQPAGREVEAPGVGMQQ